MHRFSTISNPFAFPSNAEYIFISAIIKKPLNPKNRLILKKFTVN